MVRLKEIPRTAAFAWSPGSSLPILATGTKAGAVDADFSNDTKLELWDLNLTETGPGTEPSPIASIETDSRFHDIAWVGFKSANAKGIIAGALENGCLDLWDVDKLVERKDDALSSRTSKHTGAIKTLQFNPFRSELLATAGAKGELYISDLNNIGNPFRLGNTAGRADDFECLDWNKKVAHIMVTGSSGGFVTVWDVKTKKESLTLNNQGRKPVSAVAWDPEKPTRLITATPLDTDPVLLVWDLRNSNAPERVLRGHDGGIMSLSWCQQDNDLLLSCGKDNRTLCWNPQSGESYGEFPVVTNWTFQTGWNPHNPNLLATASFDGKITVQTIQNTKVELPQSGQAAPLDGEDFFAKASTQPQSSSFSLPNPPKWLKKPNAVSFGFGGKVVSVKATQASDGGNSSEVKIIDFNVDDDISASAKAFSKTLEDGTLTEVCETQAKSQASETEKKDWDAIKTLFSANPRKELVTSLGFQDETGDSPSTQPEKSAGTTETDNGTGAAVTVDKDEKKANRLSSFFDKSDGDETFLADLASTKGASTNNPFHIYVESESAADKQITRALMLGQFDKAMQVCLDEDRLSDAFMIAVCGGQSSIEKVQQAYFKKQASGPHYLRLLASVVGKNLWDVVYNADLENWKEVMATLCTYANAEEFPELCESLGDRLEEQSKQNTSDVNLRQSASFCYIAGSKLEKVVPLWIADLEESEKKAIETAKEDNSFSIHARVLQNFIEKVTVFREVTRFQDTAELQSAGNWKLSPLYEKYSEYAEIIAAQGQLQIASRYLDLLPSDYPAADVARNRILQATRKSTGRQNTQQAPRSNTTMPGRPVTNVASFEPSQNISSAQNAAPNPYAPPQSYYQPATNNAYGGGGYPVPQQAQPMSNRPMIPPPPVLGQSPLPGPPAQSSTKPPPSKMNNMPNWNDTPEDFFKPPTSRRGTPGAPAASIPPSFPGSGPGTPPIANTGYGSQPPRANQPAPPPPKGPAPPPRNMTPVASQPPERPSSAAANAYAPQPGVSSLQQHHPPPQIHRGPSPYNAPPPSGPPGAGSRYAPAPAPALSNQQPPSQMNMQRPPPPPNPYAARPNVPIAAPPPAASPAAGRPTAMATPPPPPSTGARTAANTAPANQPSTVKHPNGDRSHIPAHALPIYELLDEDMQRVKARAPASFKPQVIDTEKRLNILFDHLNNETLLKQGTVSDMVDLSQAIKTKDYERAHSIYLDIHTNRTDECVNWMLGVKRLIGMSKATP